MKPRIEIEDVAIAIALLAIGGGYAMHGEQAAAIERAAAGASIPADPGARGGEGLPPELGDDLRMVECPWLDLETGKLVEPIDCPIGGAAPDAAPEGNPGDPDGPIAARAGDRPRDAAYLLPLHFAESCPFRADCPPTGGQNQPMLPPPATTERMSCDHSIN